MFLFPVYTLILVIGSVKCKNLTIIKNYDESFYPVTGVVEEKVGNTFSLICELQSDEKNAVDDHLIWVKSENSSNYTRFPKVIHSIPAINKSEKKFDPLQAEDKGLYTCISQKFNLTTSVTIFLIDNIKKNDLRPMRETFFCNNQMFQCISNGVCIIPHYVCDGKPDCKDASDESLEKCNGEPCKNKIPCDDGRCIPSSWCCDRHHDPNCTVTFRPNCCQSNILDSYEEMEFGYPGYQNINHNNHNGARYLFISVCIISILFSIVLLLLIVSKVMIFAKKSALQQQRQNLCENIALRNQTNVNIIRADFAPSGIYTVRNNSRTPRSNIIIDASEASDPLLRFNLDGLRSYNDQPPSYVDVLRNNSLISEPPPPYTSREILNCNEERQERR